MNEKVLYVVHSDMDENNLMQEFEELADALNYAKDNIDSLTYVEEVVMDTEEEVIYSTEVIWSYEEDDAEDKVACEWCGDITYESDCRRELNLGLICSGCQSALYSRGEKPVFEEAYITDSAECNDIFSQDFEEAKFEPKYVLDEFMDVSVNANLDGGDNNDVRVLSSYEPEAEGEQLDEFLDADINIGFTGGTGNNVGVLGEGLNNKDAEEFYRLCREIGIYGTEDLDNFRKEVGLPYGCPSQDLLQALRDWREELGPDFEIMNEEVTKLATNKKGDYLVAADSGKGYTVFSRHGVHIGGFDGDNDQEAINKFNKGDFKESLTESYNCPEVTVADIKYELKKYGVLTFDDEKEDSDESGWRSASNYIVVDMGDGTYEGYHDWTDQEGEELEPDTEDYYEDFEDLLYGIDGIYVNIIDLDDYIGSELAEALADAKQADSAPETPDQPDEEIEVEPEVLEEEQNLVEGLDPRDPNVVLIHHYYPTLCKREDVEAVSKALDAAVDLFQEEELGGLDEIEDEASYRSKKQLEMQFDLIGVHDTANNNGLVYGEIIPVDIYVDGILSLYDEGFLTKAAYRLGVDLYGIKFEKLIRPYKIDRNKLEESINLKESQAQEIGREYSRLSKKYGIDFEDLVYGEEGFMKTKYPDNFPDFAGDVIYSEKYWNELVEFAKEKGIDLKEELFKKKDQNKKLIEGFCGNESDIVLLSHQYLTLCKRDKVEEVIKAWNQVEAENDFLDLSHDELEEKIAAYTQYGNFEVLDSPKFSNISMHLDLYLDVQIGELVSVSDYVEAMLPDTEEEDGKLYTYKYLREIGEWVYGAKFERLIKPYKDIIKWLD